jgi:hypothetical protein
VPELALPLLLSASDELHARWEQALGLLDADEPGLEMRESLTLDACRLVIEHGAGLRLLVAAEAENSAFALLRVQHEALLRATWTFFAAPDHAIQALAAPHTPQTLKRANGLPLAGALLSAIESSDAPAQLKRGLREFRDVSWAGVNSYAHAGLLPLGRAGVGHHESQVRQAVEVSNAHGYAAYMLAAQTLGAVEAAADLNVIAVAHPGCMRAARPPP